MTTSVRPADFFGDERGNRRGLRRLPLPAAELRLDDIERLRGVDVADDGEDRARGHVALLVEIEHLLARHGPDALLASVDRMRVGMIAEERAHELAGGHGGRLLLRSLDPRDDEPDLAIEVVLREIGGENDLPHDVEAPGQILREKIAVHGRVIAPRIDVDDAADLLDRARRSDRP